MTNFEPKPIDFEGRRGKLSLFSAGARSREGSWKTEREDSGCRDLLVEDNQINRDSAVALVLERRGYQVAIALDGEQGVSMAGLGLT